MTSTLFKNVRIFDGSGSGAFLGTVVVSADRIASVSVAAVDDAGSHDCVVDGQGRTLMPGLIESHAHLGFGSSVGRIETRRILGAEERMARAIHAGAVMVRHGYTSAYSGGAQFPASEVVLREEFAAHHLVGPRLKVASFEKAAEAAARKGGPRDYSGAALRSPAVDEFATFVRDMAQVGVDTIKLLISGESGVVPGTSLILQLHDEEVAAVAAEARANNLRLSAHAHSAESIKMALRHGFDVLYHCSWADEEALDLMEAQKDHIFVAPGIGINWANVNSGWPSITAEIIEDQKSVIESICDLVPEMRRRGIRVLPGGDYGFPFNPIGDNARDLKLFVDLLGFTPLDALKAATSQGGEIMGMGHELGLIRPDYLADLILVEGDPTRDVSILMDPDRILLVMQDGIFTKSNPMIMPHPLSNG